MTSLAAHCYSSSTYTSSCSLLSAITPVSARACLMHPSVAALLFPSRLSAIETLYVGT